MPDRFVQIKRIEVVHCPKHGRLVSIKETCVDCPYYRRRLYVGQFCGDVDCDQVQCGYQEGEKKVEKEGGEK